MGNDEPTVVLFEGVTTVDVDGVSHDAYMTAHVQGVGHIVRWYGTLGWLGKPDNFRAGGFFDIVLSDGREARIRIPHSMGDDGKLEFLGVGLPPGFEWFSDQVITAELSSTTLPGWRIAWSRILAVFALLAMVGSIWSEDNQWKFLATGTLLAFTAIQVGTAPKGKKIKEVDSGNDA
jgi:hypothetical protein